MNERARDNTIGVVVIGRNEGERLRRCLESVRGGAARVVYVDSGSTDGSIELAESLGVDVVELDLSTPFTAARARNAGYARLGELGGVGLVQFVDGDCEIAAGWLDAAAKALRDHADTAAVAGRLRELRPEASIYNRLCDMEWDAPVGEVAAVGGVSMFRSATLDAAGGFNSSLIAGEEPELCVRLREAGWTIRRLPAEMGRHDAAMTRFGQWWKRAKRGGYAAMEGAVMHGRGPFRHKVRDVRSALLWGAALPAIGVGSLIAAAWYPPIALAAMFVVALYGLWVVRMILRRRRGGAATRHAVWATIFALIAKFAYIAGFFRYWRLRLINRRPTLIEYKDGGATTPAGDR